MICKKCRVDKPLESFGFARKVRKSSCKVCEKVYRRAHYLANRDHTLAVNKAWSAANPGNAAERSARWYRENADRHHALMAANHARNRDRRNAEHRAYYRANRGPTLARMALRRARRRQATPSWITEDQRHEMQAIYTLASKMTELADGIIFHVDHIVPLAGKNVCGLHVPWNLQILEAKLNLTKHNRHAT